MGSVIRIDYTVAKHVAVCARQLNHSIVGVGHIVRGREIGGRSRSPRAEDGSDVSGDTYFSAGFYAGIVDRDPIGATGQLGIEVRVDVYQH